MELGGCEERLPEESRWVGKGAGGSKADGAPNHREDCEGSRPPAEVSGVMDFGRLVWEEIVRRRTGRAWIGRERV